MTAKIEVRHQRVYVCSNCGEELKFDKRLLGNTRNRKHHKKGIFRKDE